MKRLILLLTLISTLIVGYVCADPNPPSGSFTLNTSTFTAITTTQASVGRDIAAATSDSTAWIFSEDEAGTTPITIPAPGSLSIACRKMKGNVLFYAKASAGTPSLSLIVGICRNN